MSRTYEQIDAHRQRAILLSREKEQALRALALANHRIGEMQKEINQLRAAVALHDAQDALRRKKETA